MPDGRRAGTKTDSSFPSEDDGMPQSGKKSSSLTTTKTTTTTTRTDGDFGKVGSTVEMNTEKQKGLTDNGGRRRRRSSSSGDSDLVVLSVVFNKKKQNDEVAIAIERLRENGVNCVLFTMNDFRNGNRKPESVMEAFRLNSSSSCGTSSPSTPNAEGRNNSGSDKADSKLPSTVALMPALPSIKCEMSENSNGSTDSSTSSADIHKSVQKVINSFSPSPSPSPPPLSPQLLTAEAESPAMLQPVIAKEASSSPLHQILSPLLPTPPTLSAGTKQQLLEQEETNLQETVICSSSVGVSVEENPGKRRRRRRVRRYYTIRKPPSKKKSVAKANSPKVSIIPSSATTEVSLASSSDDRQVYVPSPQKFPLDLVIEKGATQESNEVSSTSNVDADQVDTKPCLKNESIITLEDSAQNPDSSSAVIEVKKQNSSRRKRKRGAVGRRKKVINRKRRLPATATTECNAFVVNTFEDVKSRTHLETPEVLVVSAAAKTSEAQANESNIIEEDESNIKEDESNFKEEASNIKKEVEEEDDDEEDHIPLASLLERKRAFSPDIIRGVKGLSSKLVCHSPSNNSNNLAGSDQSRHIHSQQQCSNSSDNVKRSKLEMLQCVQNYHDDEEISKKCVQDAKNNCTMESTSVITTTTTSSTVSLQPTPKRKPRRTRVLLGRRRKKRTVAIKPEECIPPPPLSPQIIGSDNKVDVPFVASIFNTDRKEEAAPFCGQTSKVKEEGSTDDDSVPSVDSGIRSSENLSDEFKLETDESSGSSSADSGINGTGKLSDMPLAESIVGQLDVALADEQLGSAKRADDSLPSTPDGMQLRRSNFYSLISDNVRKNMENYLDGRTATKGPMNKRRKRTKNSYLLNHGDNYPDDPEAPYRLHMATQVLLKLNRRRAKCKPKEDRGKSLLLYLKLLPKRPPRISKPAPVSPTEEAKEESEEPLFSGEWTISRRYICHVCGQIEMNFWDMVMHKGEQHPGVVVTHTELTGTVPQSLVRNVPNVEPAPVESVPPCSKCNSVFSTMADLHRHIFECAGNASWLEPEKIQRKKKSKRRRGFKRRLSNTPKTTPTKAKKGELPKRRPSEVFKCEFCPREFKTEGWLKNHLVTHSLPVSIPLEKLSLPSRASNNSISSRLFK